MKLIRNIIKLNSNILLLLQCFTAIQKGHKQYKSKQCRLKVILGKSTDKTY